MNRASRAAPLILILTLILAGAAPLGASAGHAPNPPIDYNVTISAGDAPVSWQGTQATGTNTDYDFGSGEPCGKSPDIYCDIILLHVDLSADPDFWADKGGGVQVRLKDYMPFQTSDFDLQIFESDASGTKGRLVGSSGNFPGLEEATTVAKADGYYLVQVVYFAVTESSYTGEVRFITRAPVPPDIDQPPGLQASLASDPAKGYRSHSEPHIAQNPVDPELLVAGSKFYNLDPDSLPEYEFKVGTYVSFDRALTWSDLGPAVVCPSAQAPPDSWPNSTCYPADDPARDGTGAEDGDRGGGGDFGEEYITSDPWLQWDDEGNAYLMVLDAPPFESGAGWGMTLHKWESVSPADLASGETWGERIPINHYGSGTEQDLFLDDKNTFAVNNAGPDRDGQTGVMVACWGLNVPALIKQEIVCKSSFDGGETWPGEPIPVSGLQPLVIGVHVVADQNDPLRFYAVWLQYATGLPGGEVTMEFSQTLDGGLNWTPPVIVATLNGVPRTYPGQSFRNLSIPILAASPAGELYLAYADYRPAPDPANDADERQADIMLARSDLMGLVWDAPVKVNQDNTNADQFQPYVVVDPFGQVEVSYFDRRHDPDNFYIDTFLSRSSDGGATWVDLRLSHDMWDPSVNPPISGSGDFIGDYQGLTADECFSIPFVNDTHLANDPGRDPEFDDGLARSIYQEVFAWRVPNTAEFGGSGEGCPDDQPGEGIHVTGGGQAPGAAAADLSFGLNVRTRSAGSQGSLSVVDHGTGQSIKAVAIDQISFSGNEVLIDGSCRINDGPAEDCQVRLVDHGQTGAGQDEFHIQIGPDGASYQGGGVLSRGNIRIH